MTYIPNNVLYLKEKGVTGLDVILLLVLGYFVWYLLRDNIRLRKENELLKQENVQKSIQVADRRLMVVKLNIL
jgi:sugar phosphate permease